MQYDDIVARGEFLDRRIDNLQKKLKRFPAGTLICTKNGKYVNWIMSVDGKKSYICKDDVQLAGRLAEKKYYELELDELIGENKAIKRYLRSYKPDIQKRDKLFGENSYYRDLLKENLRPDNNIYYDWKNVKYEKNPKNPEHLIYKCLSGNVVRSKSETIIDQALFLNKIPYRYECMLQIGNNIFYPDFTIRHPQTGKIYYWEHFGMMDDPAYAANASKKIEHYLRYGIVPGVNLIVTYETKNNPLSSDYVNQMIKVFFFPPQY